MLIFTVAFVTGLAILAVDVIFGGLSNLFSMDLEFGDHVPDFLLGLLSPSAVAAFLITFGGTGLIMERLSFNGIVIGLVALLLGIFAGHSVRMALKGLRRLENTGAPEEGDLVGLMAEVTTPIGEESFGTIRYKINSNLYNGPAKSYDHVTLKQGETVVIVAIENHVIYVSKFE